MADESGESRPLLRKTETGDFVLSKIKSYDELKRSTKEGGGEAFNLLLERIINDQVEIKPYFEDQKPFLFKCLDMEGNELPFVMKAPFPPDTSKAADGVEKSHRKHVELLGHEFVEDMTRITIKKPQMVEGILQRFEESGSRASARPETVDVFIQDLRGIEGKLPNLWAYIVKNRNNMKPEMKRILITFFERMQGGMKKGYVFDMGEFPDREFTSDEEERLFQGKKSNVIVDAEGPSFIDSGSIMMDREGRSYGPIPQLSAQLAIKLLQKEIELDFAMQQMREGRQRMMEERAHRRP